jgi:hypothetical protein
MAKANAPKSNRPKPPSAKEVSRAMKATINGKKVSKKDAVEAAKKVPVETNKKRKFPLI